MKNTTMSPAPQPDFRHIKLREKLRETALWLPPNKSVRCEHGWGKGSPELAI